MKTIATEVIYLCGDDYVSVIPDINEAIDEWLWDHEAMYIYSGDDGGEAIQRPTHLEILDLYLNGIIHPSIQTLLEYNEVVLNAFEQLFEEVALNRPHAYFNVIKIEHGDVLVLEVDDEFYPY